MVMADYAAAQTPLTVPTTPFQTGGASRLPRDQSAFGNTTGRGAKGIVGPLRKGDKSTPLYLNADELEYDTRGNRVIARGNVEIYYNNYALTADRVVYDQAANTITAEGNAKMREPDGAIISSEKLVTTADFADGLAALAGLLQDRDFLFRSPATVILGRHRSARRHRCLE